MSWLIERHQSVGSTMDIAEERARNGCPAGLVIVAEEQTEGRGQRGRRWTAPAGTSLLMTLVARPGCPGVRLTDYPEHIGRHTVAAIERLTGLRPELKHPNDVIVNGRKMAGVLCQSAIEGERVRYVLIGMGINVNIPAAELPLDTATSLQVESGQQWDLEELMTAVLDDLEQCGCLTQGPPVAGDTIAARRVESQSVASDNVHD